MTGRRLNGLGAKLLQGQEPFLRVAGASLGLQIAALALNFGVSLGLARALGVVQFGVYSYAMAWATLLTVPASLGLPNLAVRNLAAYARAGAWQFANGFLRWSHVAVVVASVVLAAASSLVAATLSKSPSPALPVFVLAMGTVPLNALSALRQGALRGLHRVVRGQVADTVVRPLLMIALLAAAALLMSGQLDAVHAAVFQVIATAAAFLVGTVLLRRATRQLLPAGARQFELKAWMAAALPLLLISAMHVVNRQADMIMLGIMNGPTSVGLFRAADRGAQLVSLSLLASGTAIAPTLASLSAGGRYDELQRTVSFATRAIFALSLPVAIFMIVWGREFLGLFGPEFTGGYSALVVLSIGQLVNAAAGVVSILLMMTGHERDAARGVAIGATTNVALNAVLIPLFGTVGAAAGTASSIFLWNLILVLYARRRLGINPTLLSRAGLLRR